MPRPSAGRAESGRAQAVPRPGLLLQELRPRSHSMSPSEKKRPKNIVIFKIQENKKLQDKTKQTASKRIERDRLKMYKVGLLPFPQKPRLYKPLLPTWQNHHEDMMAFTTIRQLWGPQSGSQDNNVCKKVKEKSEELQKAGSLKKQLESIGEPMEPRSKDWKPKLESKLENKAKEPHVMVPREQKCPKGPRTSSGVGLRTRAKGRQLRSKGPQILFLKVYHHRTPMGDKKQPGVDDQWVWFDGLPTRVRVPGPRVMCRPSALRSAKRCCTRFCSASLEMPMRRQYKVV